MKRAKIKNRSNIAKSINDVANQISRIKIMRGGISRDVETDTVIQDGVTEAETVANNGTETASFDSRRR